MKSKKKILKMFHQSLLSQRQFARLNNIPKSTLRSWVKSEGNKNLTINMKNSGTKNYGNQKMLKDY